ncbi:uncharacterized protein IL334_006548 [Kwoniella shivajii]|uniref:Zn(2)-C6 fungal-type domain-containing protein n=1 Tax=Kwoniella shivajii TaxID=564305 RepID=A0ABZ1D861_9TREE|nr:hypothetical protein IL334_006548 [Kwoniella shivajii]
MSPTNYTLTPGESSGTSSPYTPPNDPSKAGPSQNHHHPYLPFGYSPLQQQQQQHQHTRQDSQEYASSSADKSQRSRDGCLTCRTRKVKCNEVRPICDKCRIKARECLWPSGDESERRRNKKRRMTSIEKDQDQKPNPNQSQNQRRSSSNSKLSMVDIKPQLSSLQPRSILNPPEIITPSNIVANGPNIPITTLRHPPSSSSSLSHMRTSKIPTRRMRGTIHVPPGFLPAHAPNGRSKEKNDEVKGDLVDWLVPEKVRATMMMDPSFLEPYFPTVDERLVIRHYLSKTVHIIIAFESDHHPWNPWVRVHAPLAFKHLPGSNPAADALRAAILAVGGVHLTYSSDPADQAAAWRITKSAKNRVLNLVQQTLQDSDGKPKVLDKENTELVLAALLSCTIASSLAADDSWHDLLSSVLSLIDQLGGAQNILRDAPRDKLSPYRFFMEQLAIRDVFGCMTTELAPSILQDAFTPWFFEAESWSRSDLEWESVERMFGISRGMVDMIARACNLIASVRAINRHLPEDPKAYLDPPLVPLNNTAQTIMAELRIWDDTENFTPLHPRTQYGNHSYRHAIRIRMLRKVYSVPSEDERVVKSSQAIIELAGEMLALYGKITWLTWPILIAGFEIPPSHPSRITALEMLGAFGPYACFDNRAAARMLSDYWMWHDINGDHASSWEVARTLNQRPFLD